MRWGEAFALARTGRYCFEQLEDRVLLSVVAGQDEAWPPTSHRECCPVSALVAPGAALASGSESLSGKTAAGADQVPPPWRGPEGDIGDTMATAENTGLGSGSYALQTAIGDGTWGERDVDIYQVTVVAGAQLVAETSIGTGSNYMDTVLTLFDASGQELAYNDDYDGLYSRIDYEFATAGTYFVGVSGYPNFFYDPATAGSGDAGSTGDYAISLTVAGGQLPGEIRGSKWNDVDGDRQQDESEPGLPGWTIYVDANRDGDFDEGEPHAITGADGSYVIAELPAGIYAVAEVPQPGWVQMYPDAGASGAPMASPPEESAQVASGQAPSDALGAAAAKERAAREERLQQLADHLVDNEHYRVQADGTIIAIDPQPDLPEAAPPATDLDPAQSPPFPLGDTFRLHSKSDATKVVYLDFNGHTTSGTLWNTYWRRDPIVTPAYSFEGDSSFSNAELEQIQKIWERVAEDFLPFDVDVTTEDPGLEALRNTGGSDTQWGVRVVIGPDVVGTGAGGIAYVGSFTWSSDTPCFVFNTGEATVAEAATHEVGHTLGLVHDGTTAGVEYYEGHGSGSTSWAPIMGVGYYRQLVQWSKGEYPGANNAEDDLAIITTTNGFGYRIDDHGSSVTSASPLDVSGPIVQDDGVVERTSDADYFVFATQAGEVTLNIDPFYRSPNLDLLAQLYDQDGAVVATSNPLNALNASFQLTLAAGTYYLSVQGTGKPAAGADYGYTAYGSLGYYSISGTIVAADMPGTHTVTVANGASVPEINFGNRQETPDFDFGDAPDSGAGTGPGNYQTLSTDQGPTHIIGAAVYLGAGVDNESEAAPTGGADGDDVTGTDDEDGLVNPAEDLSLVVGVAPSVRVVVTNLTDSPAVLSGWIDYNADGVLSNTAERASLSIPAGTPATTVTLEFPVVPLGSVNSTYARFRLSTDAAAQDPTGPAADGEVEDYPVTIDKAPRVTGVWVRGNAWTASYLAYLQASGLGHPVYGFALPVGSANQLKTLPWTNVDTVSIGFSEEVVVAASHLAVWGVNVAQYAFATGGFVYDSGPNVATWRLSQTIPSADRLRLDLDGDATGVTDLAGHRLDGEWVDAASSFPSGNAEPGGDFRFRINMLAGDVNQSGKVTFADYSAVKSRNNFDTTHASYAWFYDVNGSGKITFADYSAVKSRNNSVLPTGEPGPAALPSAAPAPGIGGAVGGDRASAARASRDLFFHALGKADPDEPLQLKETSILDLWTNETR
ncbi:MAG: GEVED domain-containing protein [Pirellulaceae bacterium]|nr:GEVED domain-containing protein [Pirellulaceae bacterium]